MKSLPGFKLFSLFFLFSIATNSVAHHVDEHAVELHTNDKWDECAMSIDPSLTQNQWQTFSKDLAPIIYFKPTNGAKPLGKGKFDIGLEMVKQPH